jgi:hypothetical protein
MMDKIAAKSLMITTGTYWLMECSTAGDCLARPGGEANRSPRHRDQVGAGVRGQGRLGLVGFPVALSRVEPWSSTGGGRHRAQPEQHQQPSHVYTTCAATNLSSLATIVVAVSQLGATTINTPAASELSPHQPCPAPRAGAAWSSGSPPCRLVPQPG